MDCKTMKNRRENRQILLIENKLTNKQQQPTAKTPSPVRSRKGITMDRRLQGFQCDKGDEYTGESQNTEE